MRSSPSAPLLQKAEVMEAAELAAGDESLGTVEVLVGRVVDGADLADEHEGSLFAFGEFMSRVWLSKMGSDIEAAWGERRLSTGPQGRLSGPAQMWGPAQNVGVQIRRGAIRSWSECRKQGWQTFVA